MPECEVLPVRIPRRIPVPEPAEMLIFQSDEYMCLDFDSEQGKKPTRPTPNHLLSNLKQLLDFENQSFNSTASTVDTLSMNTRPVDACSVSSVTLVHWLCRYT